LQEPYITQRADRYVLPIRADAPEAFPGIVHDTSQSGATLFIEPASLVDDGNRLKIAQAAVTEEEKRILSEYTREIAGRLEDIRQNLIALARFDLVLASQRLGQKLGGRMVPVSGTGVHLIQAQHPLMQLAGDPVVSNDIRLLSSQNCLVITGPNAGGKTVALKTVGIVCLFAQAGLPAPVAEGSRIGLFGALHAVIGDAQDIQRGLSTFSAHVSDISRILKDSGAGTLVLLDELAADTDPRHGAALASSIMECLVEKGATTIVTTHYEELKQLAYQDERIANASVGFDMERMEPTYQLHPDLPGRSLTLDIARRLGVPEEVLQAAASRLDGSERELERMLRSLEEERQALEGTRRDLASSMTQASQTAEKHRHATEELAAQKRQLLAAQSSEVLSEIKLIRKEVGEVIESLRSNPSIKSATHAGERLKDLQGQLRQISQDASDEQTSLLPGQARELEKLRPGDRILVTTLGKEGQITGIDHRAGMVSVRLGSTMRTRVPAEQVRLLAPAPPRKPAASRPPEPEIAEQHPVEVRSPANTLDLTSCSEPVSQPLFSSMDTAPAH
jgi:DNA mismatch repair protein MutS2